MFAVGDNTFGQFGDGTTLQSQNLRKIQTPHQFSQISAGALHVLAVEDGRCYGWGQMKKGQLGDKPPKGKKC